MIGRPLKLGQTTMTDRQLEDLIDLELAKQAWCVVDIYYDDDYWRTEWSDSKGEIVRRESCNDVNGYEIILPQLNVMIVSNHIENPPSYGHKIFPVDRYALTSMFLTGKDWTEEEKELPN